MNLIKEIDLTQIDTLSQAEQKLFNLEANQVKKFKFTSTRWEIPKYESDKENAKTNFNANFEFSIVQKINRYRNIILVRCENIELVKIAYDF